MAGAGGPRFPAQESPGMISRFSTMCEAKARAGKSRSREEGAAGAAAEKPQLLGVGASREEGCKGRWGSLCSGHLGAQVAQHSGAETGPGRQSGLTRAGILPDGNAEGEGHKAVTSVCEGLQGQSTEVEEGWGEVRCGWGDGQGKGLEV